MLARKKRLILDEVTAGTGAQIRMEEDANGIQSGLVLSFLDLKRSHSPAVTLRPKGLNGFVAHLSFGNFAADTIRQMQKASDEEVQLARALIASIKKDVSISVTIEGQQSLTSWKLTDGQFTITAEKRGLKRRYDDDVLVETCRELVTPMLAAMAELYGYDPVVEVEEIGPEAAMEGAVSIRQIRKRERNPRNRLLCLRIHGESCQICKTNPKMTYGKAGGILEVHHVQPLALSDEPRVYDPTTDLIPLCPNCHRAVHTRRPVPWKPEQILEMMHTHG
ncbi:HNH endonuclease [Lutimaribacter saemankumensis]|uniref:5-methylcytosine-specific restriction enzyme A n=1 Tax=Lutimaribacter saemankumensis TaxID=490829 RepID=A0A1G8NLG0_9RHOB|nr:HNH endonuclease [Lutimaribacter saemankumensis]SDI81131.1 5-methylcytosine-specific restriction enzyme A [Lutimaribacter saemankumensis]